MSNSATSNDQPLMSQLSDLNGKCSRYNASPSNSLIDVIHSEILKIKSSFINRFETEFLQNKVRYLRSINTSLLLLKSMERCEINLIDKALETAARDNAPKNLFILFKYQADAYLKSFKH